MKKIIFSLISVALLTSCGLFKNYKRPEAFANVTENIYRDTTSMTAVLETADTANFGNTPWREVFTDPKLQALIEKVLVSNDMQKADMNIEKAKAYLTISKLAYIPSLVFAPSGELTSIDHSKAVQTYTLPISASWNIGSFGSLQNAKKYAKTNLFMAKAAKQATQTALIAAVAQMYYTLQMLDEQYATAFETSKLWEKNVEAMKAMKEAGMVNNAAVAQASANYHTLCATLPTLQNSIRQTENALCVLLAEAPHAIDRNAFGTYDFPESMQVGIPVQLLSNRPDVRIAEAQLAAAFYNVNIARSKFYPSITISGVAGWTNNVGAVVNPGKLLLNAAASLAQPLFMNGQLVANLKVSKLDYEAAALDFHDAVLKAGAEVSNALSDFQTAHLQQQEREKQVQALETATEETLLLFQHSNTTTYLETLTAQQGLLSAKMSLITDKYNKLNAGINLYKALGGGRE
ncbi:MAG: efflux transporter outer membrane subunit [Bacteroidaceae bacterium]|nr:efflux transporter outer membrane subunit [Bacteroidaceae bacterium]